ncbi:PREDICTED: F-box/kelch-repeat protein At4g29370 [Brassica oleracea var. oleracea]|uniref:F-box/kelch-repeat protein At4g29370 n=1 Tax=Brassica oleracea var. oleracea TaxID=109376 RepID=UPI0006A74590|nr:PREDICTED: F-box/kelch-repeat protein At4g29370 [Brassica oleracea var. oleracea]
MIPKEEVEPPQKKAKLPPPPPPPPPPPLNHQPCLSFSSLPNDITLNFFARIPKSYYPKISLVSKTFRSLLSSSELYAARFQMGTTVTCLYICLEYSTEHFTDPSPRWFSLYVKPKRNLTDGRTREKSSGNLLVPVPKHSPPPPPPHASSTIMTGSQIYVFGGPLDDNVRRYSSAVRVYECRNKTWRNLPNMNMERFYASACVHDDKIYVMGGCIARSMHESWFEMFDIKTQTWKTLPPNPDLHVRLGCKKVRKIGVVHEKIYVKTEIELRDWVYDMKEKKWSVADVGLSVNWSNSWCVIDNVMFSYSRLRYVWYDLKNGTWKDVRGLEVLKKYRSFSSHVNPNGRVGSVVELVNYGGKLVIIWDRFERRGRSQNKNIWCAVVALERIHEGFWGKIEWFDVVHTVPKSYEFLRCLPVLV